jgi:putative ATPase
MASSSTSFEECPVCQNQIPSDMIETHVNQCFEKQVEKIQKSPAVTNTKKRQINPSSSSKSYDIFNRAKKVKVEEKNNESTSKESNENDDVVITEIKPKVPKPTSDFKPLAELMRPTEFEHYVGQKQAVGENSIIRNLLNNNTITSAIFWGPPGNLLIIMLNTFYLIQYQINRLR